MELLLTGDTISAAEAHRMGLVNRIVPADELAAATDALIGKLTSLSGSILRYTRRAARLGATGTFDQALSGVEALYLEDMMRSHDAHEGLAAFMEKRPPQWKDQ
jgi:enoyl-CoA hydratase/carnithine racemase